MFVLQGLRTRTRAGTTTLPWRPSAWPALRALICLLPASGLAACGVLTPQEQVRHEYRISVSDGSALEHNQFAGLVEDFNGSVGYSLLSYSRDRDNANSPVRLVKALEQSTGKLGFGGVVVVTSRRGLATTRTESMRIELDRDYVLARVPSGPGETTYAELRLLFFHEVGHGLGFGHGAASSDVMYHDLLGEKDYDAFYARVRDLIEFRANQP